jgi:hypothetical protein
MAAEMFGKVTGLGRGKGGHMHLFDPVHKFSCSGIIGASLPPACGAALAAKKLEATGHLRVRGQQVRHLGGEDRLHGDCLKCRPGGCL